MTNMYLDHARNELQLLGQFEEDPEFSYSLLAAIAAFSMYPGHSGSSHDYAVEMLSHLLRMENLSDLTTDPEEWQPVGPNLWQNRRNGAVFSKDGGNTHYNVNEPYDEDGDLPVYITKKHIRGHEPYRRCDTPHGECVLNKGHENRQSEYVGGSPAKNHVDRWGRSWGVGVPTPTPVEETIDHGEAYGVASAAMAEPSDFAGGESDAGGN